MGNRARGWNQDQAQLELLFPMSTEEHLDPIPDSFILQPPVFHPVSKVNKNKHD